MDGRIIGGITLLFVIMIIASVTPHIRASTQMDCSDMPGYNPDNPSFSTGWAEVCVDQQATLQSAGYGTIILIVMPVVAVLVVIRMVS